MDMSRDESKRSLKLVLMTLAAVIVFTLISMPVFMWLISRIFVPSPSILTILLAVCAGFALLLSMTAWIMGLVYHLSKNYRQSVTMSKLALWSCAAGIGCFVVSTVV